MSGVAVSVRGIGKRYRLRGERERYARLTESISNAVRRGFRRGQGGEEFWALKDVSFDVPRGEVVGIIGRNGAGKSTLLKTFSRITEPTEGEAILRGRVGSLLEVGTGFHPELTGRENIYLSGSILGMRRAEIRRRFDEIVDFAEVDRFLDTPVKHYSSGMQVRLGFAIAAHLEPEILVVDEVLAVGDAAFQKKSLAKMEDVAHGGRTVLFVSHNLAAVESLCSSGVLLDRGHVAMTGPTSQVVGRYLQSVASPSALGSVAARVDRSGDGRLRIVSVEAPVRTGERSSIRISYVTQEEVRNVDVLIGVYSNRGESVAWLSTDMIGGQFRSLIAHGTIVCSFERLNLMPGTYSLNIHASSSGVVLDYLADAAEIEVGEGDYFGAGKLPPPGHGHVLVPHSWSIEGHA